MHMTNKAINVSTNRVKPKQSFKQFVPIIYFLNPLFNSSITTSILLNELLFIMSMIGYVQVVS